jgi:hypothetical protein
MKPSSLPASEPPARHIDARIKELEGWRGKALAAMRALIHEADPSVTEEWKWCVPVWSHNGIICTGEAYKTAIKLTFAKGASIDDPTGIFNSSLEGNTRRAIDIREGETVNAAAFKKLIRAAVAHNLASAPAPKAKAAKAAKAKVATKKVAKKKAK